MKTEHMSQQKKFKHKTTCMYQTLNRNKIYKVVKKFRKRKIQADQIWNQQEAKNP